MQGVHSALGQMDLGSIHPPTPEPVNQFQNRSAKLASSGTGHMQFSISESERKHFGNYTYIPYSLEHKYRSLYPELVTVMGPFIRGVTSICTIVQIEVNYRILRGISRTGV